MRVKELRTLLEQYEDDIDIVIQCSIREKKTVCDKTPMHIRNTFVEGFEKVDDVTLEYLGNHSVKVSPTFNVLIAVESV